MFMNQVSKVQWYFTNISDFLFTVVAFVFSVFIFYCIIRYGIPYFYHKKYENIYDD